MIGHYHVLPEQKVGQLSRGERAGSNLALALARSSELLILDEPTLGLDVVAKRAFLESLLYSNAADDCTVIYCSHQMEEIERVADNLIILERGRLMHMSAPDDFCSRVTHWVADIPFKGPEPSTVPGLLERQRLDGLHHSLVLDQDEGFAEFLRGAGALDAEHAGGSGSRGECVSRQEPRRARGSSLKERCTCSNCSRPSCCASARRRTDPAQHVAAGGRAVAVVADRRAAADAAAGDADACACCMGRDLRPARIRGAMAPVPAAGDGGVRSFGHARNRRRLSGAARAELPGPNTQRGPAHRRSAGESHVEDCEPFRDPGRADARVFDRRRRAAVARVCRWTVG